MSILDNKMMTEITTLKVRDLCERIVKRGGRAMWAHAREIISSVYRHANDRGHGPFNPVADIKPVSIAVFEVRERSLQPEESGIFSRS